MEEANEKWKGEFYDKQTILAEHTIVGNSIALTKYKWMEFSKLPKEIAKGIENYWGVVVERNN